MVTFLRASNTQAPDQAIKRRNRRRGAETIEFTMVLLPLFAILFVLFDASWAIFTKATLQYAVRVGVRTGITITGTEATAAGETLTQMVKDTVQSSALGLLKGTSGRALIYVNFFAADSSSATGVSNVCGQSNADQSPNIMQVSVQNFQLKGLVPRVYYWLMAADTSATVINVVSADEMEPSTDIPTVGTCP